MNPYYAYYMDKSTKKNTETRNAGNTIHPAVEVRTELALGILKTLTQTTSEQSWLAKVLFKLGRVDFHVEMFQIIFG
jgi:hypothetical protein